jgi:uncharacterized membrane protein YccC
MHARNQTAAGLLSQVPIGEGGMGAVWLSSHIRAREIQERLAREHPELSDLASEQGGTLNNMALIDRDAGHFAEARKKLLQAIEWQRQAIAVNPKDPGYRRYLKTHLKNLIAVCKSLDDTEGVADAEPPLSVSPRIASGGRRQSATAASARWSPGCHA